MLENERKRSPIDAAAVESPYFAGVGEKAFAGLERSGVERMKMKKLKPRRTSPVDSERGNDTFGAGSRPRSRPQSASAQMQTSVRKLPQRVVHVTDALTAMTGAPSGGFQPLKLPNWASKHQKKAADGAGAVSHDAGDWNVFYLFLHEEEYEENCRRCPLTTSLLQAPRNSRARNSRNSVRASL